MPATSSANNRIDFTADLLHVTAYSQSVTRQPASQSVSNQADKAKIDTSVQNLIVTGISDQTGIEDQLYLLPASMARFLLRRAKIGQCPPIPILRTLGLRTEKELASDTRAPNYPWRVAC
jgi:hypothetical protein